MNRIKELRIVNGWRQGDLAHKLNISDRTVGHYETGRRAPDLDTIHKLCDIFGCTADYLLGRSEQATPELTGEESRLVSAFREADEDARAMVLLALKRWLPPLAEETKNAAS